MNRSQVIFLAVFVCAAVLASMVNFTPIIVGKLKFTLFDLFAPIAGGFLGTLPGIVAVFLVEVASLFIRQSFTLAGVLHLFPVLFGTWYFASNKKYTNLVPVIAIAVFLSFPQGRAAWYYTLFWTIPLLCSFFKERNLVARALGATFTTHAAGGALWIYFFNPPASVWTGLVPIVAMERLIFTATSVAAYILLAKIFEYLKIRELASIHNPQM